MHNLLLKDVGLSPIHMFLQHDSIHPNTPTEVMDGCMELLQFYGLMNSISFILSI